MGRILVLVLLVASVVVVHGAPDPLAKCAEGYNIPGVTVRCWDDGTARKCIEGAEQAQAAFVKFVWKPSKRFVQSIPSLPTKAAACFDDVLIGQGFFNQNTRPIGEAIDLISLKKYAKEPTHRGYNPKIDREYKPGVGLISIAIVMLGLFGGYFLGQTLQRSGDATQAPACMESQAEAAEPKQAKMSPKAGGYPKVTSAPARAKKAPARTGRAASTPLVVVGSQNPVKIASVKAGFDEAFGAGSFDFVGVAADSGVSEQPMECEETLRGARGRICSAKELRELGTYCNCMR
eukprot:gene8772-22003_t